MQILINIIDKQARFNKGVSNIENYLSNNFDKIIELLLKTCIDRMRNFKTKPYIVNFLNKRMTIS